MSRVLLAALATVLILPSATIGSSGDTIARHALKVARSANAKATKALAAVPLSGHDGANGTNGTNGVDGSTGPQGPKGDTGDQGPRGAEGAPGPRGVQGDVGQTGPQGTPGSPGTASLNVSSATNPDTVLIGTSWTTVLSEAIQREADGTVFLYWDSQINAETSTGDGLLCDLRADSNSLSQRFVHVDGDAQASVSASAVVSLSAGSHTVAIACERTSSTSDIEVPSARSRLTVLAG